MHPFRKPRLRFLLFIPFVGLFAAFSALFMVLWNALMPQLFGLTSLGFFQAAGLLALSRFLFGGFGGLARHHHGGFGRGRDPRHALRERWARMSPEERKRHIVQDPT